MDSLVEELKPGDTVAGKYLLDLPGLAERLLRRAGVAEVYHSGVCTFAEPDCYSYRRDGVTGRMATLVWRREATGAA